MAFCTSCGSQVDQDTRFCHKCGQPVGSAAPLAQAPPAAPVQYAAPPATYAAQPAGTPPVYAAAQAYAQAPTSRYAGFWIRFVAYIVDGLIIGIPMSIIVSTIVFVFGAGTIAAFKSLPSNPDPDQLQAQIVPLVTALIGTYALLLLGGLVLGWLYFAMMESSARQATFGKAMLNLRVTDTNGNRLSFAHASGRFFAKLVNSFTCGIGWIIAGFTEKKQGLHDLIAGTVVIRTL